MAFEELLKRISPSLKGVVYKINSRNPVFSTDDLYQEAVLFLWQGSCLGSFEDKTDSYILQGCYFYLKNYLRKNRSHKTLVSLEALKSGDSEYPLESLLLADDSAAVFRESLNNRMLSDTIRNNGLTTKEKGLLKFFAQGLTTRQIGSRIGISHVAVVKSMRKIRAKCKKYLE